MGKVKWLVFWVMCFFILSLTKIQAADMPSNPIEKEGWILDFNDEFNEGALDTKKWLPYYLPHWATDREKAKARYSFEDGALKLRIDEDTPAWNPEWDGNVKTSGIQTYNANGIHKFDSGLVNQRDEYFDGYKTKYGYFEIRAKLPSGEGGHIAWWMIGVDDAIGHNGEIDIMEQTFGQNYDWKPKFWSWDDEHIQNEAMKNKLDVNTSEGFHIYAMEWDETGIRYYFDNEMISYTPQSPDYEMMMLLNIYRDCGWDGINDGVYPKEFVIDYIRVYKPEDERTNKAEEASVTATSERLGYPVSNIIDGFASTEYISEDNITFPQYITYTWDEAQDVNALGIKSWYSKKQAPIDIEIQVSENGVDGWEKVYTANNLTWQHNNEKTESKTFVFKKVSGVKGVRLKINKVNIIWNHFSILDTVIYDNHKEQVFQIYNRHLKQYAYDGGEVVQYKENGNDEDTWWYIEEVGNGYWWLKNKATGDYMHIENLNGTVQCTPIGAEDWWSAQWKVFEGTDLYYEIINREKPLDKIHVEDGTGTVQHGEVPDTYWSADWRFIPLN